MNDNAVTPATGVILMVAITVILAAIIAWFILGMADNVSKVGYSQEQIHITNKMCDGDGWGYESFYVFGSNGVRTRIETGGMAGNYHVYKYLETGKDYCVILNNGEIKQVVGVDPSFYSRSETDQILTIVNVDGKGIHADDGITYGDYGNGGYRYTLFPGGKYKVIVYCANEWVRPQIKAVIKDISPPVLNLECTPTPTCTPTPLPTKDCGCE